MPDFQPPPAPPHGAGHVAPTATPLPQRPDGSLPAIERTSIVNPNPNVGFAPPAPPRTLSGDLPPPQTGAVGSSHHPPPVPSPVPSPAGGGYVDPDPLKLGFFQAHEANPSAAINTVQRTPSHGGPDGSSPVPPLISANTQPLGFPHADIHARPAAANTHPDAQVLLQRNGQHISLPSGTTPTAHIKLGCGDHALAGAFPKISSNYDIPNSKRPALETTQPAVMNTETRPVVPSVQPEIIPAKPTFAEAAARRAAKPPDVFAHAMNSIKPVKMNDGLTVIMPQQLYETRLQSFQFALIGRLFLPQGAAPREADDLHNELVKLFKTIDQWLLLPLGKGFFSLKFKRREDQQRVSRFTSWRLTQGFLHIRDWKPNFDPYKELSSSAQIWVRLFHLPVEYWDPEFLVGIFRTVGNVIKLDGNTAHGLVGHFARALVEIDLTSPLLDSVRVGLPENLFYVDFKYENIPPLCSCCRFVGHTVDKCRKAQKIEGVEQKPDVVTKPRGRGRGRRNRNRNKTWVPKVRKQNLDGALDVEQVPETPQMENVPEAAISNVQVSNQFNALHEAEQEEDSDEEVILPTPTSPQNPNTVKSLHFAEQDISLNAIVEDTPLEEFSQFSKEELVEAARDLARRRSIREEIKRSTKYDPGVSKAKLNELAQRLEKSRAEVIISAKAVGQPKPNALAPNSPHPTRHTIEHKLKEATDLGAHPTAYDLDPGDHLKAAAMNSVARADWSTIAEQHVDDDDGSDEDTESPPATNLRSS